jgi:zinc transport system substrate-binding protein
MFKKILIQSLCLASMLLLSCSGEPLSDEDGSLQVTVSVLPQKYVAEKIAGSEIEVFVAVPPGASPAAYEPSPSDMRAISGTDVWFTTGVQFESAWIPRFTGSNPDLRIRSTIENIERLPIDRYSVTGHDYSAEQHSHGSLDPHVWLSPELVRSQAAVIADELSLIDPSRSDEFMANLESFNTEIDSLQSRIHSMLDSSLSRSFIVFHPAWGYFADEFGLVQVPIETAGSEPSPGEMSALIDFARDNSIRAIFVSPQFSTSSAEAIAAEIDASVIVVDPLAEDWSSNLLKVSELLAETWSGNE